MNPLREKILHIIILMHLLYCSKAHSGASLGFLMQKSWKSKSMKKTSSCQVGVVVLVTFSLLCLFLISHFHSFLVSWSP